MIPFDSEGEFHPLAEPAQVRRLAVRGAGATLSAATVSLALRLVGTVALARLLTPSDFGVVTMVTTFSLLLMSFGLTGFTEAVIQPEKLNRSQASNLFWISSALGLGLTIAFAAAGPILARFFRNPLVTQATVGTSIAIFITAVGTIHSALLRRAMRFTIASVNDLVGLAVYTAVTILLALKGWGYWALVAGIVANAISTTLGAWWFCKWIPSSPRMGVGTRPILKFATKVYGRFSANYFARNFDNVLVGWRFNAVDLGFYKKAYDLFALTASQLTAPLNNVALAALSRLNDDPVLFRRYLSNSLGMVAFAGMAVGADLTLVGRDVVRLVLGSKWLESGRIFELFGPGIGVMLLSSTVGWIHLSIGKPGRWLRWTVIESTATALLFVVALPWGIAGIAVAWSTSYWLLLVPAFWYAGRPIGFGVSSLMGAVWRYAAASLMASTATFLLTPNKLISASTVGAGIALEAIVVITFIFVSLYLASVIILYGGVGPLRQLGNILLELIPSRKAARPAAEAV